MAGNINKVILIGTLGSAPEGRGTDAGNMVVSFDLATTESWRDRISGEWRERTELHRVAIFDQKLAQIAFDYLRRGSRVYIEGRLQMPRQDDHGGGRRGAAEIVVSDNRGRLVMLDKPGDDTGPGLGSILRCSCSRG